MDAKPQIHFDDAIQDWIDSRAHLTQGTLASYEGEVQRFREHLFNAGVANVHEISSVRWEDYLLVLTAGRQGVVTKRAESLRATSALQAGRITRAFLRHCWQRGWISWFPDMHSRSSKGVIPTDTAILVPPALRGVLLNVHAHADGEREARVRVAASLAFWCSMTPAEIALASCSDVRTTGDDDCEVSIEGRETAAYAPGVLMRHIENYDRLRRECISRRPARRSLVSQLGSYAPLTANAVWQILKIWPAASQDGSESTRLGAKSIRDAFLAIAAVPVASTSLALRRQTGRSKLNLNRCMSSTEVHPREVIDLALRTLSKQLDQTG